MATIDVVDAHGATITVQQPLAPGRVAAASSRPVALSTEDSATLAQLHTDRIASGASVEVIPAVTAGAYTAGFVVGGIMTFANILPASFIADLQSIALKFKGTLQTTEFDVAIFSASPAGTFADHGAPAIVAADTALLLGVFPLTANLSPLGTHTVYSLDGLSKMIVGSSTSLFAVVISKIVPVAPASTSDMSLRLGVIW
jgi:hypothetical protein